MGRWVFKQWYTHYVIFERPIGKTKTFILNGPLDTFIAKMNSVRKFGKRRATDHVMELSSKLEEEDWSFIVKKLL